jgi:hypothetical protein
LSYDTAIIFDLNVKSVIRQNTCAELQDPGESIGTKPVFRVAPDMCLQQHFFFFAGFTTAIDELSYHVTDFGYVGVSGDKIPIGENKTRKRCRVLAEEIFQSAQLHPEIYIPIEEYSQTTIPFIETQRLLFPDDFAHGVARIGHDLFDLGVSQRPAGFGRNGDRFLWKIDVHCRDLCLFAEGLFDAGCAESADHAVDCSSDCFAQRRSRQNR